MTVCVGIVVPGKGAVLGADGRLVQNGEMVCTDQDVKVGKFGTALIAVAGIDALAWCAGSRNWPSAVKRARLAGLDSEPGSWELLGYDGDSGLLRALDSGTEVAVGNAYAIGSGSKYAFGALYALRTPRTLDEAIDHVRTAIEAACARELGCGGQIRILRHPTVPATAAGRVGTRSGSRAARGLAATRGKV